jgi:ankyrin repeat protein
VRFRVESGDNTSKQNDLGNTPLLCATENGNFVVAEYLSTVSPWHTVNKAGNTFLKTLVKVLSRGTEDEDAKRRILNRTVVCTAPHTLRSFAPYNPMYSILLSILSSRLHQINGRNYLI